MVLVCFIGCALFDLSSDALPGSLHRLSGGAAAMTAKYGLRLEERIAQLILYQGRKIDVDTGAIRLL
jgi:hypothetical protein